MTQIDIFLNRKSKKGLCYSDIQVFRHIMKTIIYKSIYVYLGVPPGKMALIFKDGRYYYANQMTFYHFWGNRLVWSQVSTHPNMNFVRPKNKENSFYGIEGHLLLITLTLFVLPRVGIILPLDILVAQSIVVQATKSSLALSHTIQRWVI